MSYAVANEKAKVQYRIESGEELKDLLDGADRSYETVEQMLYVIESCSEEMLAIAIIDQQVWDLEGPGIAGFADQVSETLRKLKYKEPTELGYDSIGDIVHESLKELFRICDSVGFELV